MKIHTSVSIVFICLFFFQFASAQNQKLKEFEEKLEYLGNLMPKLLGDEDAIHRLNLDMEDFITELDASIEKGSGFSFEDMNQVRVIKKYATIINDFSAGLSSGYGLRMVNGKTIRITRELYNGIEFSKIYSNTCADIYKLKFAKFEVYLARHETRFLSKKIKWQCSINGYERKGEMGLIGKYYRVLFHNEGGEQLNCTPKIISCEEISRDNMELFPVED